MALQVEYQSSLFVREDKRERPKTIAGYSDLAPDADECKHHPFFQSS